MSVRMRHTRAHTRNRRSHHALKGPRLSTCAECGAPHVRHEVCMACGKYRGRQVIDVAAKEAKRAARFERKMKAMGVDPQDAQAAAAQDQSDTEEKKEA